MYIIDLYKRMIRKANVSVLIYLILNVWIITSVIYVLFGNDGAISYSQSFFIGIMLYLISLTIALSPIGEWILRLQTGCKKIKRFDQKEFLEPIFNEVYIKAKTQDPSINDNIQLFMSDDEVPNAFATGRKTICITKGLLQIPEDQIKATLAHEFGHLAHKDTDLILVVSVGNLIINTFIIGIRFFIEFFHIIINTILAFATGPEGLFISMMNSIYHLSLTLIVAGLTKLWTWVGTMLVMKSSRENEYEADAFAYHLGYGNELCMMLDTFDGSSAKGLFASLVSSHPIKDDRIAQLQELGATYRYF